MKSYFDHSDSLAIQLAMLQLSTQYNSTHELILHTELLTFGPSDSVLCRLLTSSLLSLVFISSSERCSLLWATMKGKRMMS